MVCGQGIEIIGIAQLGLKIFCGRFPMNKRISQLRLLAAYSIGVGERMKSSELPSELPVRPSAEQAVKCPSNHCRGQVTQPNVITKQGKSGKISFRGGKIEETDFPPFSLDFTQFPPLGICAGAQNDVRPRSAHCALMRRDDCIIRKF